MPMNLAFSFPPAIDPRRFAEVIARAEGWGFDMAYTPDQGFFRDPFVALTYAAARTSRIALGLGVVNPYTRHPVQIARAAATLSEACDGRFVLGLGAGERANLRDKLGAPQGPFLAALRDTITVIRDLFAGKEISLETPVFSLKGVKLDFPVARPMPLYIATTDPQGYRLVGELADGIILGDMGDPQAVRWALGLVAEGARAAGRKPEDIAVVGWITTIVTENMVPVKDKLRRIIAMAARGMHKETRRALAIDEATVAKIRLLLDGGATVGSDVLADAMLDRMAIVGPPGLCLERIHVLREAGVTQLGVRMPAAVAANMDFEGNLRALATEILPKLKA
ncbi:MAG: LLM class flavin-dependent oxidoreductase [Alphaproteobacteria bacterium]|nr:LLM class flavin-dependent oxidoreductase [Alphaproteobacteria bacterium]